MTSLVSSRVLGYRLKRNPHTFNIKCTDDRVSLKTNILWLTRSIHLKVMVDLRGAQEDNGQSF